MARAFALAQEVSPVTHAVSVVDFPDPLLALIRFPLEQELLTEAPEGVKRYLEGFNIGKDRLDLSDTVQLNLAIRENYFRVAVLLKKEDQTEEEEPKFTTIELSAEADNWAINGLQDRKKPSGYEWDITKANAVKEDRRKLHADFSVYGALIKRGREPLLKESYQIAAELTLVQMAQMLEPWAWALLFSPVDTTPEAVQLVADYGYAVQRYSRLVARVLESGILQTREDRLYKFLTECQRLEPGVPVSLERIAEVLEIPLKNGQLPSKIWATVIEQRGGEGLPPRVQTGKRPPKRKS